MRTESFDFLFWISLGISSGALVFGFGLVEYWIAVCLVLVQAVLWGIGFRLNWDWSPGLMLFLSVAASATGIIIGVWPGWCLLGMIAALAAWDLQHFVWRVGSAGRVLDEASLKKSHLQRLAVTLGLGLFLSVAASVIQLKLSFGIMVLLGFMAVVALSQLMTIFKRSRGG